MHEDATNRSGGLHADERSPANPFELALDAVGMGTWDWHISSGNVVWSPRTYELFGFEPGVGPPLSHDLILKHVYEEDRSAVARWCERAVQERTRTALEFRIVRADDRVRWVRSTGRVIADGAGHVVHMVGVVDDVTAEKEGDHPPEPQPQAFSTRQLARILGIAEVSVKRLAADGTIESLRSSRKDSRRFAPEDVVRYLRRIATDAGDFASSVAASDLGGALAALLSQLLAGRQLEDLLDQVVRPVARTADAAFMRELLARAAFLGPERQHTIFPALLARAGAASALDGEFVRCLLRARGHDVLSPADGNLVQLVDVAARIRARVVVFLLGPGTRYDVALGAAAEIARGSRSAAVGVWSHADLPIAPSVTRISSMRELASLVRRS